MEEIALASREQGEGISEVTKAVGQMDTVTQQNSALVEQTAAASESLKVQAHALVEVVSRFRVTPGGLAPA
jgi:methyl-accepting chemotaxis protein